MVKTNDSNIDIIMHAPVSSNFYANIFRQTARWCDRWSKHIVGKSLMTNTTMVMKTLSLNKEDE